MIGRCLFTSFVLVLALVRPSSCGTTDAPTAHHTSEHPSLLLGNGGLLGGGARA